jgi:hypothetical protein
VQPADTSVSNFTTGSGSTVTVTGTLIGALHPSLKVIVYVVVEPGEAFIVWLFEPIDHVYVYVPLPPEPVAVNVAVPPGHIAVVPVTIIFNAGDTFTVTVVLVVHPFASVIIKVYVVAFTGLTVAVEPFPPAGAQA